MIHRWSALKKAIEGRFSPALRGRVALHMSAYRKAHDQPTRGYITIDGAEVWQAATLNWWQAKAALPRGSTRETAADVDRAAATLRAEGVFDQYEWWQALWGYLNLSIETALDSDNVLVKALAYLDRRLGRRRFLLRVPQAHDHELVVRCYRLRAEAEGWTASVRAEA